MTDPRLHKLKMDLRAILQSAGQHGSTLEDVERDYLDLFDFPMPYAEFGASSTPELLANMRDIVLIMPAREGINPTLYYAMPDPSTRHLENLIDRQRVRPPTRFGGAIPTEIQSDQRGSGGRGAHATGQNGQASASIGNVNPLSAAAPPGYKIGPGYASVVRDHIAQRTEIGGRSNALRERLVTERLLGTTNPPRAPQAEIASQARSIPAEPAANRSSHSGQGQQQQAMAVGRQMKRGEEANEILRKLRDMQLSKAAAALPSSNPMVGPPSRPSILPGADVGPPPLTRPIPLASSRQPLAVAPPATMTAPIRFQAARDSAQNSSHFKPMVYADSSLNAIGQHPSAFGPPVPSASKQALVPTASASAIARDSLAPESAAAAAASVGPPGRQRHDSGSSIAPSTIFSRMAEFPEEAPILLQSQLPAGVKMQYSLWQMIYGILRDQGGKWLDVRQFQTEYARRAKKPLSAEYLLKTCGIKSYKQMFIDLPHIDVMHSPDEVMYVRLMSSTLTKKNIAMFDVKPRFKSVRPQTHGGVSLTEEMMEALDSEENLLIPEPPPISTPFGDRKENPSSLIPQDIRVQIYHLLWNQFRNGTDISTFSEAFTKRYGASLNTMRDCNMPLDKVLHYMGDLIDTGKAVDGKIWLRPLPYDQVRGLYKDQKRAIKERRKRGLAVATKAD